MSPDEVDEREVIGRNQSTKKQMHSLSRPCDLELSHLSKYVPALTGRFFEMSRLWAGKKGNVALFLDSLRKASTLSDSARKPLGDSLALYERLACEGDEMVVQLKIRLSV